MSPFSSYSGTVRIQCILWRKAFVHSVPKHKVSLIVQVLSLGGLPPSSWSPKHHPLKLAQSVSDSYFSDRHPTEPPQHVPWVTPSLHNSPPSLDPRHPSVPGSSVAKWATTVDEVPQQWFVAQLCGSVGRRGTNAQMTWMAPLLRRYWGWRVVVLGASTGLGWRFPGESCRLWFANLRSEGISEDVRWSGNIARVTNFFGGIPSF